MTTYIGKNGELRFYDGTATPFFLDFVFEEMDFSGPLGVARLEEIPVLDRANLTADFHYVQGSDEAIVEPVEISFSCRLDDTHLRQELRDVLDIDQPATWLVGGDTWISTKGDTQRTSGDGTLVTLPAFSDPQKRTSNLEILWDEGANDIGMQYNEVYYMPDQQEIGEAEDSLIVSITGQCYGSIVEITALTAGNQSSP